MSRLAKWKLEKTKVKVVFRLQFHATHIPQTGWEKLFISFIPTESGKTTAKTTKANARNGTCKWSDPIYETTRLLQDSQSRQYDEKFYKLVVASGTSRSSVLGEAIINLAEYVDALKPSTASLPLHGSNSGTILHVTVQLLTSKTGFREFEQQRELREKGLPTGADESGTGKLSSPEETTNDQMDKVNARVRFGQNSNELPSPEVKLNEEQTISPVGFDGSSSTSGSLYTEKHEIDSLKSTVSGDLNLLSRGQSPSEKRQNSAQGSSDCVQGWVSDYSTDNDLAIAYEENSRLRGILEVSETSIFELKLEVSSLQSHADELGVETKEIANQLAAEIVSGEEMQKEILLLKSECSKLKDDLEGLKTVKVPPSHLISESSQNEELLKQLEEAKVERGNVVKKMERMECYYEALVHKLEENQKQMVGELEDLRNEHSTCLNTISTKEAEILKLSEERRDIDSLNKEFERRAINSEAALKRARLNYSIAVDQLQKDLELLSFQVLSMYETHENLIMESFSENLQPYFKGYPNIATRYQNQVVISEEKKKPLILQEDHYQKIEELSEMHSSNLYMDVFSKILQETLLEANIVIRKTKEKMDEFSREFEITNATRDDMLLQNQILEAKLESVSKEKYLLVQTITEYKSYKNKYETCSAEKLELESLLKLETLRKGDLQNEISSLKGELKTSKDEYSNTAVLNHNLQKIIDFLNEKLHNLLASYDEKFSELSLLSNSPRQCLELDDFKGNVKQLEDIQHYAHQKILQLTEEKKDLKHDRSAILGIKQKFRHEIEDMAAKLDVSNALVEKLQSELESVANKFRLSSEIEEKYAKQNIELISDFALFEDELQKLSSKNEVLAQEILSMDIIAEELGRSKLSIAELTREKEELTMSLNEKSEESAKLISELESLKESLNFLHDELHVERDEGEYLKTRLLEVHEYLIASDVELTFIKTQYEAHIEMLVEEVQSRDGTHKELQKKHFDLEAVLNRCLESETYYIEENGELLESLATLQTKLEAFVAQNTYLSDSNNSLTVQLEECRKELETSEVYFSDDNNRLKHMLENAEEEIDKLISSKEELEIVVVVLKANLEEKILKMEEFRNLSVHLKELNNKAAAERSSSVTLQESLRIAFLKEQYETKLQELGQQLRMSKKHGDEMMWKLQDVANEIENMKKSEASHLKKNEELAHTILELEAELQSVLSDKREKFKDFDRINAELECALLSLECCKEEKDNLEASLQECMKEKSNNIGGDELQDARLLLGDEDQHSVAQSNQDVPDQGDLLDNSKHLAIINDHFQVQSLKSSMEHLHEELERMKNGDSLLQQTNFGPNIQDSQRELMQLHEVNQELGSIYPLFNDLTSSGNALERVLALEIELAESLRDKKKPNILFQSSFLKQHGDEEAIFRSFRDINELIKDMLELKGRYSTVETDLKEMHDRYSQLSLQFAEVEGERQKLMMKLKNGRSPKNLIHSSPPTLDHNF